MTPYAIVTPPKNDQFFIMPPELPDGQLMSSWWVLLPFDGPAAAVTAAVVAAAADSFGGRWPVPAGPPPAPVGLPSRLRQVKQPGRSGVWNQVKLTIT